VTIDLGRRHAGAALRLLERRRSELRALARAFPNGEDMVAAPRQRLDRAGARLAASLQNTHDRQRIALARLSHRLAVQSPQAKMARAAQRLEGLSDRMRRCLVIAAERKSEHVARVGARLRPALLTGSERHRNVTTQLSRRLAMQSPRARIELATQSIARLERRMQHCLLIGAERREQNFTALRVRFANALAVHMRSERERIGASRRELSLLNQRQARAFETLIDRRRRHIGSLAQLLGSLGYRQVLARGFALIRDEAGHPLRSATAVAGGMRLDLEFSDGHASAIAEGEPKKGAVAQEADAPPKRANGKAKGKADQGSLF
jgi:exodeoxyribonuclease VII large subunit